MRIYFRESSGNVSINGQQYTIDNHCVEIQIPNKWQLLEFQSDTYIKILDMELDGQKIKYLIHIMFDQNQRCTFGDIFDGMISYMPIHPSYPIFRSTVVQQLPNGWYGQQIYEHYEFCLDRPVEFKHPQPKHIRDYFAIDTGAHWIKKFDEGSSWFFNEEHDVEKIKQEIDCEMFENDPPYTDTHSGWSMRNLKNPTIQELQDLGLTFFVDLATKHNFTKISSVSCNILQPGGHIGIHVDNTIGQEWWKKIYLNLDPSDEVYFKFGTTGLIPMNTQKSIWLNADGHVHAVVNDTDRPRRIVAIRGRSEWT